MFLYPQLWIYTLFISSSVHFVLCRAIYKLLLVFQQFQARIITALSLSVPTTKYFTLSSLLHIARLVKFSKWKVAEFVIINFLKNWSHPFSRLYISGLCQKMWDFLAPHIFREKKYLTCVIFILKHFLYEKMIYRFNSNIAHY